MNDDQLASAEATGIRNFAWPAQEEGPVLQAPRHRSKPQLS